MFAYKAKEGRIIRISIYDNEAVFLNGTMQNWYSNICLER
jgi:hypothetical protein